MASRAEVGGHAGGWIPKELAWRGLDKGRGCICPHGLAQASPAFLPALGPSRPLDPRGGSSGGRARARESPGALRPGGHERTLRMEGARPQRPFERVRLCWTRRARGGCRWAQQSPCCWVGAGALGAWGESRGRLGPTWRGQQEKGLNCGFVRGALLVGGGAGRLRRGGRALLVGEEGGWQCSWTLSRQRRSG